jgi:hypothetical protein
MKLPHSGFDSFHHVKFANTGRIWKFDHGGCQYGDAWASIIRDDLHCTCTCQAMGCGSDNSAKYIPSPMTVGA